MYIIKIIVKYYTYVPQEVINFIRKKNLCNPMSYVCLIDFFFNNNKKTLLNVLARMFVNLLNKFFLYSFFETLSFVIHEIVMNFKNYLKEKYCTKHINKYFESITVCDFFSFFFQNENFFLHQNQ